MLSQWPRVAFYSDAHATECLAANGCFPMHTFLRILFLMHTVRNASQPMGTFWFMYYSLCFISDETRRSNGNWVHAEFYCGRCWCVEDARQVCAFANLAKKRFHVESSPKSGIVQRQHYKRGSMSMFGAFTDILSPRIAPTTKQLSHRCPPARS